MLERPTISRRQFLSSSVTAAAATHLWRPAAAAAQHRPSARPWYQRTYRWVQTNLNEDDPPVYDQSFWTAYWRRTRAQGVIVNAGGIVAYYPTRYPWHHRADRLGDRDLFGEIAAAARQEGLTLLARMDSTRTYEPVFTEHPDWFARDRRGRPFKSGRLYTVCVNGPWITECVPAILREIAERYRPDGFTDNSWSGLGQDRICYCAHCEQRFHAATGRSLPDAVNWNDAGYRAWIEWNYARRLEIWDAHNRVTREAGGSDCHWMGMVQGDPSRMCAEFRQPSGLFARMPIVMLDWQARQPAESPYANAAAGAFVHSAAGWQVLVPESLPLYQGPSAPIFRHAAKPEAEVRLWAVEGIAAGIQPWFHHLGSTQRDRRQFTAAEPIGTWHAAHEEFLVDREPVASVAVAWSERNIDWYGRGESRVRAMQPYLGIVDALISHRIPWQAVNLERLDEMRPAPDVLILPNIGAMSDGHCEAVRRFVARGGGLLATGETSACDAYGDARTDLALADLLGAHLEGPALGSPAGQQSPWSQPDGHTYLQLRRAPDAPALLTEGLDETDILPFGGFLPRVRATADARVILSWLPPYPASPPEDVRPAGGRDTVPALIVRTPSSGGRIAYSAADLDRCYARDRLPDHARVIANCVRWLAGRPMPVAVEGPGLLDVHLYRQPKRAILHVVNLTNPAAWRGPATEVYPVGPLRVTLHAPADVAGRRARCLVHEGRRPAIVRDGDALSFEIETVVDHEVIVIE